MFNKRLFFFLSMFVLFVTVLAACTTPTDSISEEPVQVVTETIINEAPAVAVTMPAPVVTEGPVPSQGIETTKDLVICQIQEPDTLYPPGSSMLASTAVRHAIWTWQNTELSFDYQPVGIKKIPSLANGDARIADVEVRIGEIVVDSSGEAVVLKTGIEIVNAEGKQVVFDGLPVMMKQLTVDFEIMPRKFSDGEDVTADDYLFTYNIYKDPDTGYSEFTFERTKRYEKIDDLNVRWTGVPGFLDSTYFLNAIPGGIQEVFPEHLWSGFSAAELLANEMSNRLPVGDGAFRIVEWAAGDKIVLEPNEYFWGQDRGLPYLDSLTYKFIPDANQLIAQLLKGDCHIGTQDAFTVRDSPFLIEAENNGLLTTYFQIGTVWEHIDFGINSTPEYAATRPDWFEDVRVRQAITMCTNRQAMVDNILYGRSEVIHSYIPSIHPLYPDQLTEWPYDVIAANALLDEVGFVDTNSDGIREFPAGEPFSPILGTTTGNQTRQQIVQIFKDNMLDCGIDVQLQYLPATEWFADGPEGPFFGLRFDMVEFAWLTGVEPPCELYLSSQIPTPENGWAGQNATGYSNRAFDAACLKAKGSLPGTADYEEGHAEAQILFSEELPVIPLFLPLKVAATRPEVLNFRIDPTQNSELHNIYEIDLQQ
jgi:peptide/nickel transport system substrate-binding protein